MNVPPLQWIRAYEMTQTGACAPERYAPVPGGIVPLGLQGILNHDPCEAAPNLSRVTQNPLAYPSRWNLSKSVFKSKFFYRKV